MTRRTAFVVFPGFQILDATGPIAAFDLATRFMPGAYAIELMAIDGGMVASSSGVAVATVPLGAGPFDTIILSGGGLRGDFAELEPIVAWVRHEADEARRVASVCSGAFFLAEAGLLDGRRATTHWSATDGFARRYPAVTVEPDRIYIRDGATWTSGGITAGIDLALALIEDDLGSAVARSVAQVLVVHQRRPGGQSQHSALLDLGGSGGRFADLIAWMHDHLHEPLSVERLAEQAGMSPRHFARCFTTDTKVTPAKAVERLRLELARTKVERSDDSLDRVAEQAGFGSAERLRRAFLRAFGQPPQALRRAAERK